MTPGESDPSAVAEAAEKLNDEGLRAFKAKNALAVAVYDECLRLKPDVVAYLGNAAAARLKLGGKGRFRDAARDCERAVAIDPEYVRGWVRLGQARFFLGDDPEREDSFDLASRETPRPRSTGRWRWTRRTSRRRKRSRRCASVCSCTKTNDDDDATFFRSFLFS